MTGCMEHDNLPAGSPTKVIVIVLVIPPRGRPFHTDAAAVLPKLLLTSLFSVRSCIVLTRTLASYHHYKKHFTE